MSYGTIAKNVSDMAFGNRVMACIAQEQIAKGETVLPSDLSNELVWAVASADDVEAAYESALASNNPNPGADEGVITDGMILSNVQAHWPASTPPA